MTHRRKKVRTVAGYVPGALERQFREHLLKKPRFGKGVFIAPGAVVLGDVRLGEGASVWYHAVLRGDINQIRIGRYTNIQDQAVLHMSDDNPCVLGDYVTVGHGAIVHACRVGNEALIGMGSVILDGVVIGEQSLIGARALVPQGMVVPPGSLVLGVPGRVTRALTAKERAELKNPALKYAEYAAYRLKHGINVPTR